MVYKRNRKKTSPHHSDSPTAQRLNKILAAAGLGSRRKVEQLIEQGRVQIDGDVVTDLACKVDPGVVKIKVDGELLKRSRPVYYALNKPPGVLSTNYDPSGRMRVIDLVPDRDRVFSVGRLDQSSEGLMLLTNDGELAQRLAHPKFRIQKAYFVVVSGQMSEEELMKLRKGVHLAEGLARIDGATIKRVRKGCTELEIVLSEGKNREIRRILARAGHKVVLLRRIAIGPLRLGQLPVGASRTLTPTEVKALYSAAAPTTRANKKPVKKGSADAKPTFPRNALTKHDEHDDDDDLLSLAMQGMNDDGEEDLADDDFVGGFQGSGRVGSVLVLEGEPDRDADSVLPARGRNRQATKNASGRSASGKSTSERSPRGKPYAKATAKARSAKSPDDARAPRGAKSSQAAKSQGPRSRGSTALRGGKKSSSRSGGAGRTPSKRGKR